MEPPKLHAGLGAAGAAPSDAFLRQTGFSSNRLQIAGQITRGSAVECQARARAPERRTRGGGEGGGWSGLKYFAVQVTGVTVWEGIFHSATQSDDAVSIVLNSARVVRGPGPASAAAAVPSQQLEGVVSIKASADDSNGSPAPAFGTDAEIGQRVGCGPGQANNAPTWAAGRGQQEAAGQCSCCTPGVMQACLGLRRAGARHARRAGAVWQGCGPSGGARDRVCCCDGVLASDARARWEQSAAG